MIRRPVRQVLLPFEPEGHGETIGRIHFISITEGYVIIRAIESQSRPGATGSTKEVAPTVYRSTLKVGNRTTGIIQGPIEERMGEMASPGKPMPN